MNVADQLQQKCIFLANNSFIPTLKQMTALMVNTVKVLGIRLLQPLHEFRQRRSGTFQQQVNVIRHQTIRINHDSVSLPIVRKPFQVDLIVLFLEKGFLSLVSPYNNVIKNTRSKQSGL